MNFPLQVVTTMKRIKHVLRERWYAWENATEVARLDPSVDLDAPEGMVAYDESSKSIHLGEGV